MQNPVRTERRGPVLEITLDRPKVNAIDAATSRALGEAFATLRDDDALRAGIVTGAGEKIFSAGWDLKAVDRGEEDDANHGPGGFAGLTELWDLNKPVIAAVNGFAVGGGLELALACDLIVAAEHAEFSLPETILGLLADGGAVQRLPRRIPYNIALELLLLGRRMGAAEAAHYGLVNAVVPGPQVMDKAREWARTLAEAAPLAVQAIKEVLHAFESLSTERCFALMRSGKLSVYERMSASEDRLEGVRAFVEKRKPVFRGR
ncbi:MAG: enoyl-CoA hydratase-related protein [Alphaproteobacteria bacterium]